MDHVLGLAEGDDGISLTSFHWIRCLGHSVRPSCGAGGWHRSGTIELCWSSAPMPALPLQPRST